MSEPLVILPGTHATAVPARQNTLRWSVLVAATTMAFIVGACTESTASRMPSTALDSAPAINRLLPQQPGLSAHDASVPRAMNVFESADGSSQEAAPTF